MYTKKFIKRFNEARTFGEWLETLKRFNYSLVRENNLMRWTMQDYKNLWNTHKGAKV